MNFQRLVPVEEIKCEIKNFFKPVAATYPEMSPAF
jgi:hypothetical protein